MSLLRECIYTIILIFGSQKLYTFIRVGNPAIYFLTIILPEHKTIHEMVIPANKCGNDVIVLNLALQTGLQMSIYTSIYCARALQHQFKCLFKFNASQTNFYWAKWAKNKNNRLNNTIYSIKKYTSKYFTNCFVLLYRTQMQMKWVQELSENFELNN